MNVLEQRLANPVQLNELILPALWVLSPSMEALLAYAALRAMTEALSHANLTWGSRTNRLLKWVLVTPGFHRVHHCAHLP